MTKKIFLILEIVLFQAVILDALKLSCQYFRVQQSNIHIYILYIRRNQ